MKLILIALMLTLLTSCFEKPVDFRFYSFPPSTINYNLINYEDPNDSINIDVSVLTIKPEQIWVTKRFKKLNTMSQEKFTIGEEIITKTSHMVNSSETLNSPISFNRFVKPGEQYGVRNDSIYGVHSKEPSPCYLTNNEADSKHVSIMFRNRLGFAISMEGSEERYCGAIGLAQLNLDKKNYILDMKGFDGCTPDPRIPGTYLNCTK